jgi:hypothetical protein
MKHRKIMGGRIKKPSERGAWAELYFMVLAMTYGLKVSSPYGGFGPYDVGVENGSGPVLRTQVKCTIYQWRGHFVTNICVTAVRGNGPRRIRGYTPGTVDFFAIYLLPTDDWYIFPYSVIGNRPRLLHLYPESKRSKYNKYREAWHLLVNAAKGKADGPITIQACCDEGDAAQIAREVTERAAIRKMFRGVLQG